MKKIIFFIIILIGTVYVVQHISQKKNPPQGESQHIQAASGTIAVAEQNFFENQLLIDKITISESPAWLAVYSDNAGIPGKKVTQQFLATTSTTNLQIPLPDSMQTRDRVYLLLHDDTDTKEEFEFPVADHPFEGMEPVSVVLIKTEVPN